MGGAERDGHELADRCHLALGRREDAARAADRAAATAAATALPLATAWAERAAAAVALDGGEAGLAAEKALASAAAADGAGAVLTERELEVARLVVGRRTNAEIATGLFLSIKTVESHMRNLFHKLGVSSRVEVARLVERARPE